MAWIILKNHIFHNFAPLFYCKVTLFVYAIKWTFVCVIRNKKMVLHIVNVTFSIIIEVGDACLGFRISHCKIFVWRARIRVLNIPLLKLHCGITVRVVFQHTTFCNIFMHKLNILGFGSARKGNNIFFMLSCKLAL